MDYLDFELRIGTGDGTEYPVTVIHAAAGGEPSVVAVMPVNDEGLRYHIDNLVVTRGVHVTTRKIDSIHHLNKTSRPQINEQLAAREIGQRLFDSLISGAVRDAYSSSLAKAREQGAGLRLRLSIEAPEVAVLPWEFLYDPQEGDHVSLLREMPTTRYMALSREPNTPTVEPPLRILGMVATPSDLVALDVAEEQERIQQALEHRIERGDVDLHWVEGGTWHDLQTALEHGLWHIFHYIGHGAFDPDSGEGLLYFCDEQGAAQRMSAAGLGRLFSGHPSLQLAFLNACEGGRTSEAELFSSVGSVLARRGVSAVISMQFDISDAAALEFSRLFYDALARGNPVDVAMTVARTGLSITAPDSTEWATPVLHMRTPDGHLFEMVTGASIFDKRKPVPHTPKNVPSSPPLSAVPDTNTDQRIPSGLDILRRKVQQFWIEGVLEHSLFLQTLHDLGMETMGDAVENPWGTHLEQPGQPSRLLARGQSIVDVFDEHGGSLLILGEPGSGKTTTMLDLLRTLLQCIETATEQVSPQPVPVVFNLSTWSPDFALLEDWMAEQVRLQYQIPRAASQSLLTAGHILPLLDGLDETGGDIRPPCVEAINNYVLERNLTGLVVCCRLKEYTTLPVRLALNTAVRLTELSDEQVDIYLDSAGEQLTGLRNLLRRETAMRFDARSPLWLNLMMRAYHGLSVVDLAQEGERSAADRRRALMDAYMARMFRRVEGGT
ncbi:MAG: CHAT domain-containing protein [Chloroflexota bacterium]